MMGIISPQTAGVSALNVNITSVGNVTTGEDDLMSYTLPANTLSANGKAVRVTAWGTFAANGNSKTLKIHIGSSGLQLNNVTSAPNGNRWVADAILVRTGASSQELLRRAVWGTQPEGQVVSDPAQDTTAAIIIKLTGQSTEGATDDIIQRGMIVEMLN